MREEIYEPRIGYQGIHYRMLYFFWGRLAAVVSHGLTKERAVPPATSNWQSGGEACSWLIRLDTPRSFPMRKTRSAQDGLEILRRRYLERDPAMAALIERERVNVGIAARIRALRREAGLTQRELAQRVGTTASVVSRLEDADYEGHSLNMLMRVAAALGRRVRVEFTAVRGRRAS